MNGLIEQLGESFERLLRWVYPGILFVTLLALGANDGDSLFPWQGEPTLMAVLVIIVSSVVIYGIQRHFLNALEIIFLHYVLRWSAFAERPLLIPYIDRLSASICRRFGYKDDSDNRDVPGFSDYLMNRWAAIHALGLTMWVLPFMYMNAKNGGVLRSELPIWAMWSITGILLIVHLFETVLLERVQRHYFQQAPGDPAVPRWLPPSKPAKPEREGTS